MAEKPGLLLDVMVEGLRDLLVGKGWAVKTVTESLGVGNRDDEKIIEYAEPRGLAVVTNDQKLAARLAAKGIGAFTVDDVDMAYVIDCKLRGRYG